MSLLDFPYDAYEVGVSIRGKCLSAGRWHQANLGAFPAPALAGCVTLPKILNVAGLPSSPPRGENTTCLPALLERLSEGTLHTLAQHSPGAHLRPLRNRAVDLPQPLPLGL